MSITLSTHSDRAHESLCRLWRAVIAQAIYDLTSKNRERAAEARQWIFGESKEDEVNFFLVCGLGNVDADEVRQAVRGGLDNKTAKARQSALKKIARKLSGFHKRTIGDDESGVSDDLDL